MQKVNEAAEEWSALTEEFNRAEMRALQETGALPTEERCVRSGVPAQLRSDLNFVPRDEVIDQGGVPDEYSYASVEEYFKYVLSAPNELADDVFVSIEGQGFVQHNRNTRVAVQTPDGTIHKIPVTDREKLMELPEGTEIYDGAK
jgi:recombinational DNA repair protein (RecF pathway)